ncbi:hypothetical protein KN1_10830 [Stygiolobus caldivivus]|uniref:Uncharacterized protein n=1 Tax=Stygiolobus caldivivus TaxID=2824673 RepID=A0A8D5U6L1_9CREN|nr:hypothetical protein KN1_10830 [Stygiolobus caldivivus]
MRKDFFRKIKKTGLVGDFIKAVKFVDVEDVGFQKELGLTHFSLAGMATGAYLISLNSFSNFSFSFN